MVKKAGYNTKVAETEKQILDDDHGKYIIVQVFSKLKGINFAVMLAQAKRANKVDIADFIK